MNGSRASDMGEDKIRYLLWVCGRWRWRPTKAMRARGFKLVTFGKELTVRDKARAITLNAEWDRVRTGAQAAPDEREPVYPAGSVRRRLPARDEAPGRRAGSAGHRTHEGADETR